MGVLLKQKNLFKSFGSFEWYEHDVKLKPETRPVFVPFCRSFQNKKETKKNLRKGCCKLRRWSAQELHDWKKPNLCPNRKAADGKQQTILVLVTLLKLMHSRCVMHISL